MNASSMRAGFSALFLVILLAACAGNHPGQTYPDAPAAFQPISPGDSFVVGNYRQTLTQPLVFGLPLNNKGATPITLDALTFVEAPSNITLIATGVANPEENNNTYLPVGGVEYPPLLVELHRPYILHPLSHAVVHKGEDLEALVALKSSKVGVFFVKGFLLTLEIDGQTYQQYYPFTAVLCVEVDKATCDQAFHAAGH